MASKAYNVPNRIDTKLNLASIGKTFTAIAKIVEFLRTLHSTESIDDEAKSYLEARLADAGVDLVKIKDLMGHQCIETTMRYLHTTDKGKRGAITQLSEYRQMKVGSSLSQISLTSSKIAVNS